MATESGDAGPATNLVRSELVGKAITKLEDALRHLERVTDNGHVRAGLRHVHDAREQLERALRLAERE